MKHLVLGGLAALSLGAFTLGVQAQDETVDFKLDNLSGRAVAKVAWIDAEGRQEPLAIGVRSGELVALSVPVFQTGCRYDLVVTYADGGVDARSDVNLCALPDGVLSLH